MGIYLFIFLQYVCYVSLHFETKQNQTKKKKPVTLFYLDIK